MDIRRIITKNHEQLYAHKLDKMDEKDQFPERDNLPELTQEETDTNLPKQKEPDPDGLTELRKKLY